MSEWSHLPNAAHIDHILADIETNSHNWRKPFGTETAGASYAEVNNLLGTVDWDPIWDKSKDIAYNITNREAQAVARANLAAWDVAWHAACFAILALIAWPESGDYLALPVDQVQVLSALGDAKATLLLPAIGVLSCVN